MFDRDRWIEVFNVLGKSPLRTFLTALGVIWGILMLVLMLGAGNGLRNGADKEFGNFATNSMAMWPQFSTMPYKGLKKGRLTLFDNNDMEAIAKLPGVGVVCPRNQLGGWRDGNNVTHGTRSGAFSVYGEHHDYIKIQAKNITAGRYLNKLDTEQKRKVCVIGNRAAEILFAEDEDPLGAYITIKDVNFKVVGVFAPAGTSEWSASEGEAIAIPFATFQSSFVIGNRVGWFNVLAAPGHSMAKVRPRIESLIKQRKQIHPDDNRAIGSFSVEEEMDRINTVFFGINALVWIVGILTLIAGVIGISNIMLIVVKERTKEIGVRRALGATPGSIILQILMESVFLTGMAGYIGMVLGMLILQGVGPALDAPMFSNPNVSLSVVMWALAILVAFGLLAGLIPAYRAVKINPVDALRSE